MVGIIMLEKVRKNEYLKTTFIIENMLRNLPMENTIEIMKLFGEMGLGRELLGIFCIDEKEDE